MRRHPFDPLALVFGLTFAGAAIVVLAGGSLLDEGHFLLPAGLLGLGVALLVQNVARNRPPRLTDPSTISGFGGSRPDPLDDLDATSFRTTGGVEWTGPPHPTDPADPPSAPPAAPAGPDDRAAPVAPGEPDPDEPVDRSSGDDRAGD